MELNVLVGHVLDFFIETPVASFVLLGALNGYLFREPKLLKIIAIIIIVPASLQWLVQANLIYTGTIPFLVGSVVGYWGVERLLSTLSDGVDLVRDVVEDRRR